MVTEDLLTMEFRGILRNAWEQLHSGAMYEDRRVHVETTTGLATLELLIKIFGSQEVFDTLELATDDEAVFMGRPECCRYPRTIREVAK